MEYSFIKATITSTKHLKLIFRKETGLIYNALHFHNNGHLLYFKINTINSNDKFTYLVFLLSFLWLSAIIHTSEEMNRNKEKQNYNN